MTGWQGGGWNPQQDPYGGGQGGQYGADPYGQPDPYGQYGADPYGQYGADPYGGGGYPGYQGGFEPPPPKRSKLPIVLSIVAILAIVGTVLTIVLLNRNEEDPAPTAGPGGSSAPSKPPSSPKGGPSSSRKVPSGTKKPPSGKDGWATFEFSGGTFQAPGDWKKDTAKRASGLGVDFAPGAVVGVYDCEGARYFRGFVATGEAQSRTGAELELNKTVMEFATAFAREYYRNPQLEVTAPKSTTVDRKQAATITIKLTVTPTRPACEATSGEVALIGVPIEKDGKQAGVRMLVVVNDLAGGPSTPEGLPDALAEEIVGTLTLK